MRDVRWLSVCSMALLCAGIWSCGYSTRSLVREDIKSVYVPVFDNQTFRRGYEKELTRAVIREVKRHGRLNIADRRSADSILSGELVEVKERVVTKSEADEILHKRTTISVKIRWVDNLTKRDIIPPQTVEESIRFVPRLGEGNWEKRAFREVAQEIVERMQESW